MRILVVEDERDIADFVSRGLESEGYAVTWAADGIQGETLARTGRFDLILLDVMLPGRDGNELLRDLRREDTETPVIMLTARGETADKVRGLDNGATDYLTKPFAFEELVARIRAHLRQSGQRSSTQLAAAGIEMDLLARTVEREGREIALSAKEFELLAYLIRHPGQVMSREQILNGVWGYDHDPGTNIVGVYIAYLRRKLTAGGLDDPIETVRSVGYRLKVK
ncbi:MAG: response regulator transcription factor [Solirubrobacterales bacterium]|nr:response regulator transcription factor [Solirubrobacterales bacterium]